MDKIKAIGQAVLKFSRKAAAGLALWSGRTRNHLIRSARSISRKTVPYLRNAWLKFNRKPSRTIAQDTSDHLNQTTSRIALRKLPNSRPIRRRSRERVYRLKGFTTVAKVNRKRQSELQQRVLRRGLLIIIIILSFILLFNIYNPIRDLSEYFRILGISDLSDIFGTSESTTAETTIVETTIVETTEAAATVSSPG